MACYYQLACHNKYAWKEEESKISYNTITSLQTSVECKNTHNYNLKYKHKLNRIQESQTSNGRPGKKERKLKAEGINNLF